MILREIMCILVPKKHLGKKKLQLEKASQTIVITVFVYFLTTIYLFLIVNYFSSFM